jgi:hypothetical protein
MAKQHRGERLAEASAQLVVLSAANHLPRFAAKISEAGVPGLRADRVEILQVNLGKLCNMTCEHCQALSPR